MAKVGIVMGSDSDLPVMAQAADILEKLGVDFEMTVISAHRETDIFFEYAKSLEEKGYNPINQIVGYILSEDPTYITNHNNARTLIRKIDRDELLQVLVRKYLGQ